MGTHWGGCACRELHTAELERECEALKLQLRALSEQLLDLQRDCIKLRIQLKADHP
jgi:hypothetical protein